MEKYRIVKKNSWISDDLSYYIVEERWNPVWWVWITVLKDGNCHNSIEEAKAWIDEIDKNKKDEIVYYTPRREK